MVLKAHALTGTGLHGDPCCLPVHNLSAQTRHIVDHQSLELSRSNRMLSVFVVVLSLALATVLGLLLASSPVNAMQITSTAQASTANGVVALAALMSLVASAGVGIALVRLQFSKARKR